MVVSEEHLYQTIVLPRKLATGNIHDYRFCYCPLVSILFEVRRIIESFLIIEGAGYVPQQLQDSGIHTSMNMEVSWQQNG